MYYVEERCGHYFVLVMLIAMLSTVGCDDPPSEQPEGQEESLAEADDGEDDLESAQDDPESTDETVDLQEATAEIEVFDADADRPEWLARTWQTDKFGVGSALLATYHFFEDGLFVFNNGVSDLCEPGLRAKVGSWHIEDDNLVLMEQRRIDEVGGEPVDDPNTGCELEGSTREVTVYDEPEVHRLPISDCPEEELEKNASDIEELGIECQEFSGDAHWTVSAGTRSWREEWKEWMEQALEQ